MSRTYRRRGERHEYRWVLRDRSDATPWWAHALLDSRSKEGRRAIARFHSELKSPCVAAHRTGSAGSSSDASAMQIPGNFFAGLSIPAGTRSCNQGIAKAQNGHGGEAPPRPRCCCVA